MFVSYFLPSSVSYLANNRRQLLRLHHLLLTMLWLHSKWQLFALSFFQVYPSFAQILGVLNPIASTVIPPIIHPPHPYHNQEYPDPYPMLQNFNKKKNVNKSRKIFFLMYTHVAYGWVALAFYNPVDKFYCRRLHHRYRRLRVLEWANQHKWLVVNGVPNKNNRQKHLSLCKAGYLFDIFPRW